MKTCPHCGFNPKQKKVRPRSIVDKVAYAMYEESNRNTLRCCDSAGSCSCWTGWRGDAKAAIKAMKEGK